MIIHIISNNFKPEKAEISVKASLFSRFYATRKSIWDDQYYTFDNGPSADRYFLSDVSFATSIYNEHEPNYLDDSYMKNKDNGLIITQTRLNYSGLYNRNFNDPLEAGIEKVTTKIVKAAVGAIPIVGDFYKTIKKMQGIANDIGGCFVDQSVTVDNNNEANIFTNWTKEAQLNDPNLEGYVKTAYTKPGDANNEPGLLIDNYAQMITLLNNSDVETRIFAGIAYKLQIDDGYTNYLIDGHGKKNRVTKDLILSGVEPIIQTYDQLAFEQTDIATEGENTGYLYQADSKQEYEYTPSRNGIYTITTDNNHTFIASDNSQLENKLTVELKSGIPYTINVKQSGLGEVLKIYPLNIDFTPAPISFGENKRTVAAH